MGKEKPHEMALPSLRTQSVEKAENQTDNGKNKNEHIDKTNGNGKFTHVTEETREGYKCLELQEYHSALIGNENHVLNRNETVTNNVGLFGKEIHEAEEVENLHEEVSVIDQNEDSNDVFSLEKSAVQQLEENAEKRVDERPNYVSVNLSQHEGVDNVTECVSKAGDLKVDTEDIFKNDDNKDINKANDYIQGMHIPDETYKHEKENCSRETKRFGKTCTCVIRVQKKYMCSLSASETSIEKYINLKTYLHENCYSYYRSNIQIHTRVYAIGYRVILFPENPLTLKLILLQSELRNQYLQDESFRFATFSLSSCNYKPGLTFSLAAWGFFYDIDGRVKCYNCGHLYNFSQGQESEWTSHNHNCICRFSEGHAGRTLADYYGASIVSRIVPSGDARPEGEQLWQTVDVSVRSQSVVVRSIRLGFTQAVSNDSQAMNSLPSRRMGQTQIEDQAENAVNESPVAEAMVCQDTMCQRSLIDSPSILDQRATTDPLESQTDSKRLHAENIGYQETSRSNTSNTNGITSPISDHDTKPTAQFQGNNDTNGDKELQNLHARFSSGDDCMRNDCVSSSINTEETHDIMNEAPRAESVSQTKTPAISESATCRQEDSCKTDPISVNSPAAFKRKRDNLPTENAMVLQEANMAAQAASAEHDTSVFICAWPGYTNVEQRIASFKKCDKLKHIAKYLAEVGLFCRDETDCTLCYKCGGMLKNWESGDDPVMEHARWFPACPLSSQHQTTGHFHNVEKEQRMTQSLAQKERNVIEEILDSDVCTQILEKYRRTVVAEAVRKLLDQIGQDAASTITESDILGILQCSRNMRKQATEEEDI